MSMSSDTIASSEKSGRCERCHRKLKDPESVKRGLGPICAKKVEAELREINDTNAEVPGRDAVGISKDRKGAQQKVDDPEEAELLGYSSAVGL